MSIDEQAVVSDPDDSERPPRVFVSYSHDSPRHKEMVRQFATFLRAQAGVDAHIDLWYDDARRDWSLWAIGQLDQADFILAIASPEYKRRADGSAPPDEGRGAQFESAIIRNNLTRNLPKETRRVLPVVLPGRSVDEIPSFLCAYSTTHYIVSEFTLDGVQDLLVAFTGSPLYRMPPLGRFVPPTRPAVEPVVVAASVPPPVVADLILSAGSEVEIGAGRYLIHGDYLEERSTADHSAVHRQARALRIGPPHEQVWLRQVEIRQETSVATAAAAALSREHDILTRLRGKDSGLPRSHGLIEDGRVTTLVMTWPVSRATGGPCETLHPFIPRIGEVLDPSRTFRVLHGMAGLCRTLASLHEHGSLHRCLTPAGIVVLDNGRLVLRDLGLAASEHQPGEGPADYRAPEQQRRRGGRFGPWVDVYQVAAVTYHLLTGHPPDPAIPLPVRAQVPGLAEQPSSALDAALAVDPADRPGISALGAALGRLY